MQNPYKVLGVSDNTPLDMCKKAYRKLCAMYHPDSPTGDRDKFDEITKAWELISSGKFVTLGLPKSRSLTHQSLFNFTVVSE